MCHPIPATIATGILSPFLHAAGALQTLPASKFKAYPLSKYFVQTRLNQVKVGSAATV
jgi:hypothetical protein